MSNANTSMPGSSMAGAQASSSSPYGPQHTQQQHSYPLNPSSFNNNNPSVNNNTSRTNITNGLSGGSTTNLPLQLPARHWSMMTRTIAHYERLEQIGEGTYGQVYKARCLDTDQIVALKKIRVHHGKDWGMPPTVIREIKILKRLQHPNLVRMMEVVSSKGVEHMDEEDESTDIRFQKKSKDRVVDAREGYKGNLFLVLEYVSHDLTGLMDVAYQFTPVEIKCIFRQLLEALRYMHENKYVHRDIKSSNILLDHHFRVKLADFGLSRCFEPPILDNLHDRASSLEFTNKVITLWYRPPEILLGATQYGPPVDVWSAGCILAELLLGKPLFTGKTEMDQLQLIFDMLGTPSPNSWTGLNDLKLLRTGQVSIPTEDSHRKQAKLRPKYAHKMPLPAMNLLEKLLELDPEKRLTAERALDSRYFLSEPIAPERPEDLGPIQVKDHFHEFQTKRKRRQAKAEAEKAREAAKSAGMDDEQAQEQFDTCYRKLMKKVAVEGIDAFGSRSKDKQRDRKEPPTSRDERKDGKRSDRRDRSEDDRRRKEKRKREEEDDRRDRDRDRGGGDSSRRKRREHEEADGEGHKRSSKDRKSDRDEDEEGLEDVKKDSSSVSRKDRSSRDRERDREKDRKSKDGHGDDRGERGREKDRKSKDRHGDDRGTSSKERERDKDRRSRERDRDRRGTGDDRDRDRHGIGESSRDRDRRGRPSRDEDGGGRERERDRDRISADNHKPEPGEATEETKPRSDRADESTSNKEKSDKDRSRDSEDDKDRRRRDRKRDRSDRSKDERPRDDRPRDERPRDDRLTDDRPKDERLKDDRPRDDRPKDERLRDDRPRDDRPKDERSRDDRPRDDQPQREGRDRSRHYGRDDHDRARRDRGPPPHGGFHGGPPPPMEYPGRRGGPPPRGGPPMEFGHYGPPGPGMGPPPGGGPPFRDRRRNSPPGRRNRDKDRR